MLFKVKAAKCFSKETIAQALMQPVPDRPQHWNSFDAVGTIEA